MQLGEFLFGVGVVQVDLQHALVTEDGIRTRFHDIGTQQPGVNIVRLLLQELLQ